LILKTIEIFILISFYKCIEDKF